MDDADRQIIQRMDDARDFETTTCPASRHTALCAESLIKGEGYPMLEEEPAHIGSSIAHTVAALWEARAVLAGMGLTWEVGADGKTKWIKKGEGA